MIEPLWHLGNSIKIYHGSCLEILHQLPAKSVQCIVTSPPYWGLRDYKAGEGEIGCERTPEEFVENTVKLGRGLKHVLRDDGTFFLNLGDTYTGGAGSRPQGGLAAASERADGKKRNKDEWANMNGEVVYGGSSSTDLPPGNLVGIPWRTALALQADGWVLRQDIIWHKPSPMPESVRNRCTKAHEYIFLLTKSNRYFCDMEAIKEPGIEGPDKNKRSVWTVASQPYPGAHFATFPPTLITPMILAGTSEHGACADCGKPWRRVVEEVKLKRERPHERVKRTGEPGTGNSCANSVAGVETRTVGWEKACSCSTNEVRPCIVLDPFLGSGTSASVCRQFGRHCWGIELNKDYILDHAAHRIEATPPVGRRAEVKVRGGKKQEGGFFS